MNLLSLRGFLTRLIWLCVLPLVLLATYLAIHQVQTLQAQRREQAANQVANVTTAIDRQLQSQISALNVLAASPLLDDPAQLKEFYEESTAFRENFGGHVILADLSMQMLFFTHEPFGVPLPKLPRPRGFAAAPAALETGKPAVGDMFIGRVAKEPLVAAAVPVIRDGETKFLLLSINETSQFQHRLHQVSIPAGWSLTLLDGKGTVIAPPSPEAKAQPDDVEPSERFVAKSAVSNWSVVLTVPRSVYRSQIMAASAALAIGILAATLISVVGGRMASRSLTRSVSELAETPLHETAHSFIEEVETVRRKLIDAAEARKAAENELRVSEERLRLFIEHAPVALAMFDREMRYMAVSRRWMSDYRLGDRDIIGRSHYDIFPEIPVRWKTGHQRGLDGEVVRADDDCFQRADGLAQRLRWELRPWYTVDRGVGGIVIFTEDITERKKAEEALRENEERLEHALQVGQFGSWGLNLETGRAWRSLRHDQIFGYQELLPEWTYSMFLEHVVPEDVKAVDESFGQAMRTRTEWSFECRIRRVDGMLRWIWAQGLPRFDDQGEPIEMVGLVQDITDRKQVEEVLRESAANLAEAQRVAKIGNWSFDVHTNTVTWSDELYRIFGIEKPDFDGRYESFVSLVHPDDRPRVLQTNLKTRSDKSLFDLEYRVLTRDGQIKTIMEVGYADKNDAGEVIRVFGTAQDITERKQTEEALIQSEERRRLALDAAKAGTWEWDLSTNKNFWSDELWVLYGLEPHSCDPSYEAWLETVHPDDRAEVDRRVQQAASKGNELNAEWRTKDCKGGPRWLMSRGRPLRDATNRVVRYTGIVVDITDRKRSEQIIHESEKNHRLLIENLQAGVVVYAPDTSILLCNQVAAKIAGMPQDEMIGRKIPNSAWSFLREDGSPMPVDELPTIRVAATRQPIADVVVGFIRPGSDSPGWVLANAYPALNEKNELEQIVVTFVDITDRKRAEAALAENEKKFRLLYEEAPIPYQSLDEEGYLLQVNSAWLRLLGYTRDEVIGKSFADFLSPRSQEQFRETFSAFKRAGEVNGAEHEMVCKDRSVIEVSIDGRITRLEIEQFSRTHCVLQDITQRKKAEKALQESEQRYRAVFNIASVGIDLVDQQGRFLEVNGTLSQILGYSPEEIRNLNILDVTHPDDLVNSKKMHEAIVRGDIESYRMEKRYVRQDGAVLWADVAVSAIRDADGQYRATVGVIRDITQQKKSEEARVRLAAAVEQAAETVVITDPQGRILYANPAFERITGYSRDEAVGNNPRILKSGHHDDEFYKRMWVTLTNGQIWNGHILNKKKDGTLFEEDASISPVKNASGEIVNYVAVKRDITQEVFLQRQLFQAQKMEAIGTLAGGIAHDFNNLLTVVHGFSELLLAEKDPDHPEYADLKKILHAAKSGAELVRRLLTFSRKSEPNPVPMNLNTQIVQVEKLLRRTIPRMVEIDLNLSADLPTIYADPSQVEQVLLNLALNACDAMADVGKLTVRTSLATLEENYCRSHVEATPGKHVLLEVTDTGHGMDQGTVEHIFEPFFTTKEIGGGTGLGLAMVYGIVKQHNGHITVSSEIGKGTSFQVYLPTIPAEVEFQAEDSDFMPASGTETILLVDDEKFVRELGARILSKYGYTVLQAANGREALDLFRRDRSQISLVILDLIMPEMGGAECLKELLEIDRQVNVLVASGYSADASVRKTIQMGAKGFISKPFRVKELLTDVRRVLDEG